MLQKTVKAQLASDRAAHRARYRDNPDFRAAVIRAVTNRHNKRYTEDPDYAELVRIRKKIYWRREAIERWSVKIVRIERDLLQLLKRRDVLAQKLREKAKA